MEDRAKKYEKLKMIGAGMFGKAWMVRSRPSGRTYVVKEIEVSGMTSQEMAQTVNEVAILSRLKHKNVIRYREAFTSKSALHIVMEFADQGDLAQQIEQRRQEVGSGFPEEQVLDWTVQICFAMSYIHDLKILHRDLKPANIFLTSSRVLKVGDFGIAKILKNTVDHARTAIGTPYYLSPEICQRKPYNQKSDLWALGCVLYELVTLKHPFQAKDFSNLVLNILSGIYPSVPSNYSLLVSDLVSVLLRVDPERRPDALQILNIPKLREYVINYTNRKKETVSSLPATQEEHSSMAKERTRRARLGGISSSKAVGKRLGKRSTPTENESSGQRGHRLTSSVTSKTAGSKHCDESRKCRPRIESTPACSESKIELMGSIKRRRKESSNEGTPSRQSKSGHGSTTSKLNTESWKKDVTKEGTPHKKSSFTNGDNVEYRKNIALGKNSGGNVDCKKTYILQNSEADGGGVPSLPGVNNAFIRIETPSQPSTSVPNEDAQLSTDSKGSSVFKFDCDKDHLRSRKIDIISGRLLVRSESENGLAVSRNRTVVSCTSDTRVPLNKTIEIAEVMHAGTPKTDEDTGSVRGRLESLRDYLEDKLGTVKCVDALECLEETTESERLVKMMNERIGSSNMRYFPLLLQVWNLENRCH